MVEVLATLVLLAIVLPAVTQGIHLASSAASSSRHRTEASGLAESKLNELIATDQWQNGQTAGDFGADWPEYRWQATLSNWQYDNTSAGLEQLDVQVSWNAGNRPDSITVSTLIYDRTNTSNNTGSSGSTSGSSGSTGSTK